MGYNYNRSHGHGSTSLITITTRSACLMRARVTIQVLRALGRFRLARGASTANIPTVLDYVIGGWATSHILMWHSGALMMFNQADVAATRAVTFRPGTTSTPRCSVSRSLYSADEPVVLRWSARPKVLAAGFDPGEVFQGHRTDQVRLRMEFYNTPNVFIPNNQIPTAAARWDRAPG